MSAPITFKFIPPKPIVKLDQFAIPRQELKLAHVAVHKANYEAHQIDKLLDQRERAFATVAEEPKQKRRLASLVSDNIVFDESQKAAIEGMAREYFACLTGSAGTGKTTVTKAFVDNIYEQLTHVDMKSYFKRDEANIALNDPDDDYKIPDEAIPSVCLCSYTGKAMQQIKRNFPDDWHGNIMTIHRMLAYYPEYYNDLNEKGEVLSKLRFVPAYTAMNKLPWDVIIIDEAGMLNVNLWHEILAAAKPGCRIYMIGDINQLQPTHGRSAFGFAMASWPTWELTTIHRQKGTNNSIVDNAWKVIHGQQLVPDDHKTDKNWKLITMQIHNDPNVASRQVRGWLKAQWETKFYQPLRDVIITPINADKETNGAALGQIPLNMELSSIFQSDENRYLIDAGRDRKAFAVGDKVMATKNDHEIGVTNGMMGFVKSIASNGKYQGNKRLFGLLADVNAYLAGFADDADDDDYGEDLLNFNTSDFAGIKKEEKQTRERGPASHIVTVDFHGREVVFETQAEVESLQIAYAVTCHKMQGSEAPIVIIILHHAHRRMLNREWLYTAITRAQERCIILYTPLALQTALKNQEVKGRNLKEKVENFNKLQTSHGGMKAVNVRLPPPKRIS